MQNHILRVPLSTYQIDYMPPETYEQQMQNCKRPVTPEPEPPKFGSNDESAVPPPTTIYGEHLNCRPQRTRPVVPPMQLFDPTIDPKKLTSELIRTIEEASMTECFKNQPNRFLIVLRRLYPELYEQLVQLTREELQARIRRPHMLSTYQFDYNDATRYPGGTCSFLHPKREDGTQLIACEMLRQLGPCHPLRLQVMHELALEGENFVNKTPCVKSHRRRNILGDGAQFVGARTSRMWPPREQVRHTNHSEYVNTISRNGCVIIRNHIHEHRHCAGGRRCIHPLSENCMFLW